MSDKAQIRAMIKGRLSDMSNETRRNESTWLCGHLAASPRLRNCGTLGIFLSLPDEPDLRPLFQNLDCRMALPILENGNWRFHQVLDFVEGPPGPFGLRFPALGPPVSASDLDVILIPGRAFTSSGQRLGRGAGVYDRLLADSQAWRTGIAFSCQILDSLPTEAHDLRMNEVMCPPIASECSDIQKQINRIN